MMESMLAQRSYTNTQIKPLLENQMKYTFLPQSVPAYAATEAFNALRQKYPEYSYKEATLNPSNPRDRASDWEADIVNQFRQGRGGAEIVGERDTPTGRSLYLARPIQIKSPACLVCHSTVQAAPATMIDRYGNANGFGWQLNEVIGAQVVSVPTEVPLARAGRAFRTFMLSLTGVFAFIFVSLNLMLSFIVIRPVTRLSALADQVSLGNMEVPEFGAHSRDEIGALAGAFGRMHKSLEKAMKMLEE
jgi:protein-histidine pros-kinase